MRFDPETGGPYDEDPVELLKKIAEGLHHQRYAKLVGDEIIECSFEDWIHRDKRKCIIKAETVGDRYCVSTIFLGLDHGIMDARGIWFETMVFDNYTREEQYGCREYIYCERYSTLEEARRGHLVAVDHAQKRLAGESVD